MPILKLERTFDFLFSISSKMFPDRFMSPAFVFRRVLYAKVVGREWSFYPRYSLQFFFGYLLKQVYFARSLIFQKGGTSKICLS